MAMPAQSICAYEKTKTTHGVALDVKLMIDGAFRLNADSLKALLGSVAGAAVLNERGVN